ncbi:uncharacterized protein V1513DRAFT_427160 [Lipomyces chichibuensis]|uniref:uncharacterized protein n=1 Tax=Lipomyces chichibuensis TaxID=1546026 RepID=UPI0033436F7E
MPPRRGPRDRRNTFLPSDVNTGFNFDVIPTVNLLLAEDAENAEEDVDEDDGTNGENVARAVEELPQLLLDPKRGRSTPLISRLSTSTARAFSQGPPSLSSAEISPDPQLTIIQSLSIPTVRLRRMQPFPEAKVKMNLQKLLSLSVDEVTNTTVNDKLFAPHFSATMVNGRSAKCESMSEPISATSDDADQDRRSTVLTDATRSMIGHDEWSDQRRAIANLLLDQANLDNRDEVGSTKIHWKTLLAVLAILVFISMKYWANFFDTGSERQPGTPEQVRQ